MVGLDRTKGEGPGGLIPVTGVTADETESCSSVG